MLFFFLCSMYLYGIARQRRIRLYDLIKLNERQRFVIKLETGVLKAVNPFIFRLYQTSYSTEFCLRIWAENFPIEIHFESHCYLTPYILLCAIKWNVLARNCVPLWAFQAFTINIVDNNCNRNDKPIRYICCVPVLFVQCVIWHKMSCQKDGSRLTVDFRTMLTDHMEWICVLSIFFYK